MTKAGLLLLGIGIIGWYWSSSELEKLGTYPRDLGVIEAVQEYPAARMDVLRYAFAASCAFGVVLLIMPGRR